MRTPLLKNTCDWLNGEGILTVLTTIKDVPWKGTVAGQILDDDYYGNHSGNRELSGLAENLLYNDKLSPAAHQRLANVLFAKYGDSWTRSWEALQIDYEPLSNYDMEEHETPAETTETITPAETTTTTKVPEVTTTITPAETKTETKVAEYDKEIKTPETTTTTKVPEVNKEIKTPETTTKTKVPEQTKTITPALEQTQTENNVYGFDSSTSGKGVKDSVQTVTNIRVNNGEGKESVTQGSKEGEEKVTQGTNAGAENITQGTHAGEEKVEQGTHAGAENITQGTHPGEETLTVLDDGVEKVEQGTHAGTDVFTVQSAGSNVYTTQKDRILTRKGNIGVTTSQQMLESELILRQTYNFFDSIVFPDVDKVLCQKYYSSDTFLY